MCRCGCLVGAIGGWALGLHAPTWSPPFCLEPVDS
jgi:membrane protein YqaA with SNARE-associated domain